MVANPPAVVLEQLFAEKTVDYKFGRLQRNYPNVRAGDLVVGYESTPTKRVVALARVTREYDAGRPPIRRSRWNRSHRSTTASRTKNFRATRCSPRASRSSSAAREHFSRCTGRGRPICLASSATAIPRSHRARRAERPAAHPGHLPPLLHLRGLHRGLPARQRPRRRAEPARWSTASSSGSAAPRRRTRHAATCSSSTRSTAATSRRSSAS